MVAPFTGAWIETSSVTLSPPTALSHPSRVRGLKPEAEDKSFKQLWSHPSRVRGLKPAHHLDYTDHLESHPSRVRGLKQDATMKKLFGL